jgi:single-strand DNA-binding protein
MNKVVLIGRLTKDPELKFTPGTGNAVTTFTIAVDRRIPNKDGQREADFIPVVVWGKTAESVANYVSKGKMLGVSGRIQTRSYDAKDGTKRYVTEVVADEVQFIEWGGAGKSDTPHESQEYQPPVRQNNNYNNNNFGNNNSGNSSFGNDMTPVDEGDIPF